MKIFYSWQSDNKADRSFIRKCLDKAVAKVPSFEIDTATRGTRGSVAIASTILEKIKSSDLILADISIINPHEEKSRQTPNPNVMFELGYASAILQVEDINFIANASTTTRENLPFDIKGRRMILEDFSKKENEKKITEDLIRMLKGARESGSKKVPIITLGKRELEWASDYGGVGASFRAALKINNLRGDTNYIEGVVLHAQDNMGDHWQAEGFIFKDQGQQESYEIEANKIKPVNVFLSKDFTPKQMKPDLDINVGTLEFKLAEGEPRFVRGFILV